MSEQKSGAKKSKDENPSYLVSGDRRSLELIFVRLDYAANGLLMGDYDNAMENIQAAWQRLPNAIKDQFTEPAAELRDAIERIPSEDQLWNDEKFMQANPGWKAIERYRQFMETKLKHDIVQKCASNFIRALDTAGLYVKAAGGGLSIFGDYGSTTQGMAFQGPPTEGQQQ